MRNEAPATGGGRHGRRIRTEKHIMKKVILVPDSFKGTMSSREICGIMERAIHSQYPDAEVVSLPVADGGEGSVDSFLAAMGGEKIAVEAKGPYFENMTSFYGRLPDGAAVIEMASCAGLPLVGSRKCAEKTTTYGVGMLIAAAVESGCRKIIVGLGGSATNDGGAGMAAALGACFYDDDGTSFIPTGETLGKIRRIDLDNLPSILGDVELIAMCDIDNPLCGPNGAARVFGPQKGASPEVVEMLDAGLANLARVVLADLGKDVLRMPGGGAAGGMGAGMVAFLNSELRMGIETVLTVTGFDRHLVGADMVISGEGRLDRQSLGGKVVIGVARRAQKAGVPLVAVVGDVGDDIDDVYAMGVSAVFSINRVAVPFHEARLRCQRDLSATMENILRYHKSVFKNSAR